MNEKQSDFGAVRVVGALAKRSQKHRRREFAVAQKLARFIEVLERVQRKRERDYEDGGDCKQAPAEASAQCHFSGGSVTVSDFRGEPVILVL